MTLHLVKASRLPRVPWWAATVVLAWLALVAAGVIASRAHHTEIQTCMFKRVTHLPCPSCGMTRGTLSILHGQVVSGFLHNPLAFVVAAATVFVLSFRLAFGRKISLQLSRIETRALWAIALGLFIGNWGYLIAIGM